VGKEKTLSFSQEVSGFLSNNSSYQDKMERLSTVKEDRPIYDGEKAIVKDGDEVMEATNHMQEISVDVSSQIQNVSAATEEQTAAMEEIASASESLAELAQDLQSLIAKVKY
ncbi:MAG: hypothetical protein KZY56_05090, partial [Clostridiaceae bacterium]|nr:hypothetical protein [Clostridiaceae bacterium]